MVEARKADETAALMETEALRHAERLARLESASANVLANGQEARRLRSQLFAKKMETIKEEAIAHPDGPYAVCRE